MNNLVHQSLFSNYTQSVLKYIHQKTREDTED